MRERTLRSRRQGDSALHTLDGDDVLFPNHPPTVRRLVVLQPDKTGLGTLQSRQLSDEEARLVNSQ